MFCPLIVAVCWNLGSPLITSQYMSVRVRQDRGELPPTTAGLLLATVNTVLKLYDLITRFLQVIILFEKVFQNKKHSG